MIAQHIWKIILLIALLIGGYFWYGDWRAEHDSEARMIAMLDLIEENKALPEGASIEQAGIPLFKLLVKLHNYERYENIINVEEMLDTIFKRAVDEGRVANEAVDPFKTAILTNLELCDQYGVFDDSDGLLMMENGRSPKVTTGALKGEKLLIGHFVPPTLAPETSNSFANLVLTPETVFGLQNEHIDRNVDHAAGRLRQMGAIDLNTYQRINKRKRDQTAYRVGE